MSPSHLPAELSCSSSTSPPAPRLHLLKHWLLIWHSLWTEIQTTSPIFFQPLFYAYTKEHKSTCTRTHILYTHTHIHMLYTYSTHCFPSMLRCAMPVCWTIGASSSRPLSDTMSCPTAPSSTRPSALCPSSTHSYAPSWPQPVSWCL